MASSPELEYLEETRHASHVASLLVRLGAKNVGLRGVGQEGETGSHSSCYRARRSTLMVHDDPRENNGGTEIHERA